MIRSGARRHPPRPRFVGCAGRPGRSPSPSSGERRGSSGAGRLDDGAALVAGRADDLFDESFGHPIGVVVGIDDQEIDGPDEAAGADRRSEREDGPAHDVPLRLGDEDARLRQVDELAEQVRRIERARRHGSTRRSASLKATRRSISVTRAARTRYSTPKVVPRRTATVRPSTGVTRPWVGPAGPRSPRRRRAMRARDG